MAMYKRDEDLKPYEVRGIDPDMKSLSMMDLAQLMDKPHIRQAIEKINKIEGRPRLAQQILHKAAKEQSPITKSVTEHERVLMDMKKRKIDWLEKNTDYKRRKN